MPVFKRFARLLLAAAMVASVAITAACTPAPKKLRIEVWGDSFSAQAAPYIGFYMDLSHKSTTKIHSFGGTALCDWFPDMRSENNPQNPLGFHPQVVVIQFFGDSFTNCMHDANGRALSGQALVNKYAADAQQAITIFRQYKVPVYFVSTPLSIYQSQTYTGLSPLGQMFSQLPARYPSYHLVRYIDAANPVELNGKFTYTLPCLPWETCTGTWSNGTKTVRVRESDGFHFCPVDERTNADGSRSCPVAMPGASRFALAITGGVSRDFHL